MREEDVFGNCDDYLAWAAEERDVDKQMYYLERARAQDPDRIEDVLRVAVGSQNLSSRTPGRAYIEELRRLVRNKKRREKRRKEQK